MDTLTHQRIAHDGPTVADDTLVRDTAAGDQDALRALYDRYARRVYAMSRRMLQDEESTEEVVQDTFLRVWRRAGDFNLARASFGTWVLGIAHHLAVDELRRRRARPAPPPAPCHSDDGASLLVERQATDPAGDPAASAVRADLQVAVRETLARLPGPQRAAIELAYFGGLSQSEIALSTGVPLGTIKSRVRLGMLTMQAELAQRGFGLGSE